MNGVKRENLSAYLDEFMWRDMNKGRNTFEAFLETVAEGWPVEWLIFDIEFLTF